MSSRPKTPKPGPLKATVPIASATKEGCGLWSPTPPWRAGLGQRSTGHNGKLQLYSGNTMKRTASLDTIYSKDYPREHWRRDRATQTEFSNSLDSLPTASTLPLLDASLDDRLARLSLRAHRRSRDSASDPNDEPTTQTCKTSPPKSSRSSEEGLNQEIEGIILRSESDPQCRERLRQPTPEGRKAPVADLLRRSCGDVLLTNRPLGDYPNLGRLGAPHGETEDSQDSSPDNDRMNASPRINIFQRDLFRTPIIKPIPKREPPVGIPYAFYRLTPRPGSEFQSPGRSQEEEQRDEQVPLVPDKKKDQS